MDIQEFHTIVSNPDPTDSVQIHLKYLWDNNSAKGIFRITGLDVSGLIGDKPDTSGIKIEKPIDQQLKEYASGDHDYEWYKTKLLRKP